MATLIILVVINFSLTGIFYATEFIFRISDKLSPLIYVIIVPPILIFLWWLTSMILLPLNRGVILLLVRQTYAFSLFMRISISIGIILFLILFWKGIIEFSWQSLKYHKLDTILFSIFIASLLYLPSILHNSFLDDLINKRLQNSNETLLLDKEDTSNNEKDRKIINTIPSIKYEGIIKEEIQTEKTSTLRNLKIDPTRNTPSVLLDADGFIKIRGRSIPEDPFQFYLPIEDWVTEYISNPAPVTCIDINLEIMNADTNKHLAHIIQNISYVRIKQNKFIINWYYEDNDLCEIGENLSSVLDVPINLIKLT